MAEFIKGVRRGQSFVGLLLVLLVLTLLTAFAAPRMDLTRYRSDAMARQAASVFSGAARSARQRRVAVIVLVDSATRRLQTVEDQNGNGRWDVSEPQVSTDLDPAAALMDPPRPLPGAPRLLRPAPRAGAAQATGAVTFARGGGASTEYVLYLTSDAGAPEAWRAIQVSRRSGTIQLWRFDGNRWTRGRT